MISHNVKYIIPLREILFIKAMNIGIFYIKFAANVKDGRHALYTITFSRSTVSTILTNASAIPYEKA